MDLRPDRGIHQDQYALSDIIKIATGPSAYKDQNEVDYSVVEHLTGVAGGIHWKQVQIVALTAYFDASGSEKGQPVLAVAGYLACTEAWLAFEKQWLQRLQADGLTYFHTTDFNAYQHEFKEGWRGDESRRVSLISDLVQIILHHAQRQFGVVVVNKEAKTELPESLRERCHINSYSLAGRTCAAQVRRWANSEGLHVFPEMVFEDGDKGKGTLIKRLREDLFPDPAFRPKRDTIGPDGFLRKAAIPLQAADLLAYECFDPTRKIQEDGYIRRIKRTFEELRKVPGEVGLVKPEHLQVLRQGLVDAERGPDSGLR